MHDLAPYLDHTLLRADATSSDIHQLCSEALEHGFAAVCVNGVHVPQCREQLGASSVGLACVVGFPLGACQTGVKLIEAAQALEEGATELDVVLQIGSLKAHDYAFVLRDLAGICVLAQNRGAKVKAILETALLDEEEKRRACQVVREAGAHYVKTSSGFAGGATLEDVRLLSMEVGRALGVKASGGIRTAREVHAFLEAGATRIGTSSAVAIVTDADR